MLPCEPSGDPAVAGAQNCPLTLTLLLQAGGTSAGCWLEAVWALGQRRVGFWAPGLPEEEVAGEMEEEMEEEREKAEESRVDHCLHSTLQVHLNAPGLL